MVDSGTAVVAEVSLDLATGTVGGDAMVKLAKPDDRGVGGTPIVRLALEGTLNEPAAEADVTQLSSFLNLRAFEIARDRAAALRARLLESQRLRRETILFGQRQRAVDPSPDGEGADPQSNASPRRPVVDVEDASVDNRPDAGATDLADGRARP